MSNNNTVNWLSWEFEYWRPEVSWADKPGVYIFAGLNQRNQWVSRYIGQALSFRDRPLSNHEMWAAAARLGATHIHARVVPRQAERDEIEKRLIQYYQPTLNTQLK
jgi:excinuclease UvrABC nuclease subunit